MHIYFFVGLTKEDHPHLLVVGFAYVQEEGDDCYLGDCAVARVSTELDARAFLTKYGFASGHPLWETVIGKYKVIPIKREYFNPFEFFGETARTILQRRFERTEGKVLKERLPPVRYIWSRS